MIGCLAYAFTGIFKSKARLAAENLCLRQQLIILKRRQARPQLRDADRRFWVLACRWFSEWSETLIVVKPDTVIRWHRKGWKAYWHWRSSHSTRIGRKKTEPELRELIRRMARENPLWGQRRIQAELACLGFKVCARTVARYMRRPYSGTPSPGWRQFLNQHADEIWACDLFTVQTICFRTLYVFFVLHHGTRELVHARVTANPNSQWLAQQLLEACGVPREPPRYLIHDRDGCFGNAFNRRVASLEIKQIRTPVKAPRANAIAERWVRTIRNECLDHRLIFSHQHLQRTVDEYIDYYNRWRPHRSLNQRAPCPSFRESPISPTRKLAAKPILGGLHHVYQWAA
jgi:transposase InsO family protein